MSPLDPSAKPIRYWQRRGTLIAALYLAVMLAIIEVGQVYFRSALEDWPISIGEAAVRTVASWILIGALLPLVLLMAERLPLARGERVRATSIHMGVSILFGLIHLSGMGVVIWLQGHQDHPFTDNLAWLLSAYLGLDMLIYWAIIGVSHTVRFYHEARAHSVKAARLEVSLSEARLRALRAQLNPHFLFNTLNAVSGLAIRHGDEDTADALGQVSELMRSAMDDDRDQEITLSAELDFTTRYLNLQHLRFSDRLSVDVQVGDGLETTLVPALLLQPLVENALLHGIANHPGPGRVAITARAVEGDRLRIEVEDSGPGFGPAASRRPGIGIGLRNTQTRLALLYPDQHFFAIGSAPSGGGLVTIDIPLKHQHETDPARQAVSHGP